MQFEYLNPDKVEKLHNEQGTIPVTVYDRIFFKVCPNPQRKHFVNPLEKEYKEGTRIGKQNYQVVMKKHFYKLTKADFENPENWNQ